MDPLEEPIVDLAAGGQDIPNQLPGFVALWAVTIDGRVSILNKLLAMQLSMTGIVFCSLYEIITFEKSCINDLNFTQCSLVF